MLNFILTQYWNKGAMKMFCFIYQFKECSERLQFCYQKAFIS